MRTHFYIITNERCPLVKRLEGPLLEVELQMVHM